MGGKLTQKTFGLQSWSRSVSTAIVQSPDFLIINILITTTNLMHPHTVVQSYIISMNHRYWYNLQRISLKYFPA